MTRIFILLTAVMAALCGCDNDSGGSLSYHDNGVSKNAVVPEYDAGTGSLFSSVYYVPPFASDNIDYTGRFTIETAAARVYDNSQKIPPPNKSSDNSSGGKSKELERDIRLRELEKELLNRPGGDSENADKIINQSMLRTVPANIRAGDMWYDIYLYRDQSYPPRYDKINAECIYVSPNAYWFAEENVIPYGAIDIASYARDFEAGYEIMKEKFGTAGDVDGNGKVIFLFAFLEGSTGGFFYSADKFKNNELPGYYRSNEADILYLNINFAADQDLKTFMTSTLFHELQHMILFDTRRAAGMNNMPDTWVNEGLSKLAEYYTGYTGSHEKGDGSSHYDFIFRLMKEHYDHSLTDFQDTVSYGYSLLFMRYLQERFGDGFIKGIYADRNTGVNAVAASAGVYDFNELFKDFVYMILVTGRGITDDPRYNISNFNLDKNNHAYAEQGFNLAEIADKVWLDVYDTGTDEKRYGEAGKIFRSLNMKPYSFNMIKWRGQVQNMRFDADRGGFDMFLEVLPKIH